MKFFIVENNQQAGPFSLEEMAARGVTRTTPVWREGMSDWAPAERVPELASLFSGTPAAAPMFEGNGNTRSAGSTNMEVCPRTWLTESILVTLFCCLPFGIVGIIKASSVSSKFAMGDIAGAHKASGEAKKWTLAGVICGFVVSVLYIALIVAGVYLDLN
ncbi:MAG: CD225/dispanin family protein [Paramuribaculum sp.]|nr:CD225/dispanin family protein [Paramuribaculum sp.]